MGRKKMLLQMQGEKAETRNTMTFILNTFANDVIRAMEEHAVF